MLVCFVLCCYLIVVSIDGCGLLLCVWWLWFCWVSDSTWWFGVFVDLGLVCVVYLCLVVFGGLLLWCGCDLVDSVVICA